jgi:hypothetical protein
MKLLSWNPIFSPGATVTVSVAGEGLTLHLTSVDVMSCIGSTLWGSRTAAVDDFEPARSVLKISEGKSKYHEEASERDKELTVCGRALRDKDESEEGSCELHDVGIG